MEERDAMNKNEKERGDKVEIIPKQLRNYFKLLFSLAGMEEDEEEQNDYNVSVYKILPYPPNTKDPREFFIDRTKEPERGEAL